MAGSIARTLRNLSSSGQIEPLRPGELRQRPSESGAFEYELTIRPVDFQYPVNIVLYRWVGKGWNICCEQSCVQLSEQYVMPLSEAGLAGPIAAESADEVLGEVLSWWESSGRAEIGRRFPGRPGPDQSE